MSVAPRTTQRAGVLLSAQSMEHGTPHEIAAFVRGVLGGIDLDPSSSGYWNAYVIKATTYYDRARDGMTAPWFGRMIVNPPGADEEAGTKSLVRPMWERLVEHWRRGAIDGAVWVGFAISQVGMLQGAPVHPLQLPTCFPCERFRFLKRAPGPPTPQPAPTHYNFLTLLPTRRDEAEARRQVQRFRDLGQSLGAVVRPFA